MTELRAPKGYQLIVEDGDPEAPVWHGKTEPPGIWRDADKTPMCCFCGARIREKTIMLLPKAVCRLCPIRAIVRELLNAEKASSPPRRTKAAKQSPSRCWVAWCATCGQCVGSDNSEERAQLWVCGHCGMSRGDVQVLQAQLGAVPARHKVSREAREKASERIVWLAGNTAESAKHERGAKRKAALERLASELELVAHEVAQ